MPTPSNLERREFLRRLAAGGLVLAVGPAGIRRLMEMPARFTAGDPLQPSVFLSIGDDGLVTITCHRSEMGQGVRTALCMVIADELEADWTTIRLEQAIGESFAARQPDGRFPAMVSRGIFCGAERVIRKALDAERLERPANLATQLAKWAAAYSYPGLSSIAVGKSGALSDPDAHRRIPQRPSTRRARILRATAELLSAGDYDELTLMRIAARAGVDEDTVRDWYDSPEACLMDTVDLMGLEALIVALDASRRAGDGIAGVCSGVGALMRRMADDSVLRDVLIREPPRTSAAAQQRTEQLLRNLLDVFLERVPHTGERPWVSYEATLGALWGAVSEHLRWHDPTTLTGEAPHVIYLALTPLLGAADTVAALNAQEGRVPLPKTIVDK